MRNTIYDADVELLARTPKSKRPPIYARIRREAIVRERARWKRFSRSEAQRYGRAVLAHVSDRVARIEGER
jgi:hypothetical protein